MFSNDVLEGFACTEQTKSGTTPACWNLLLGMHLRRVMTGYIGRYDAGLIWLVEVSVHHKLPLLH